MEIGIRNNRGDTEEPLCGEAWVNELRVTGLNEKPGVAAQARMQVQLADLAELNLAANYSSIGFGSLEQRLAERNREEILNYSAAATIQLHKFLPEKWGMNIPFYAQITKENAFQQFEPFERDLTVDETVQALENSVAVSGADPNEVAQEIELSLIHI